MVEMGTPSVCADEEEEEEESLTVLTEARHLEPIAAPNTPAHSWRLKERVNFSCLWFRIRLGPTVEVSCYKLQVKR